MQPRRAQPPAVGTTAQPYTAGRLPFIVTAVRKSTSAVPLRFIDALRFALDIVRSQPRTASLLSGNSVLRTDFFRRRLTPQRLPSVFQRFCAGHARGEPSVEFPAARVRRTVADSASSCCGLQISVNLQSCPVRPSIAFSGVRLIRAHAVTGCPVGFEIHWYRMQPFCCGGWPPGGTDGTNLGPLEPAPGPGMASALYRRDY